MENKLAIRMNSLEWCTKNRIQGISYFRTSISDAGGVPNIPLFFFGKPHHPFHINTFPSVTLVTVRPKEQA